MPDFSGRVIAGATGDSKRRACCRSLATAHGIHLYYYYYRARLICLRLLVFVRRVRLDDEGIRKSSSFFPDWICVESQRGVLPRPDHVSAGRAGFLYLGITLGYGRRGEASFVSTPRFASPPRSSCRNLFSNLAFSAFIFRASVSATSE